jgi:hypothetical protein
MQARLGRWASSIGQQQRIDRAHDFAIIENGEQFLQRRLRIRG